MGLYLGSKKSKLSVDNIKLRVIVPEISYSSNGVKLLSSDNYMLKDSNGLYLIAKEDK